MGATTKGASAAARERRVLLRGQGLSQGEIASREGVSQQAVSASLQKADAELRSAAEHEDWKRFRAGR